MKGLLDTNIFIDREKNIVLNKTLSDFFKLAEANSVGLYIHPFTIEEINEDKDIARQTVALSKMKAYPVLDSPPALTRIQDFPELGDLKKTNHVDDSLLLALKHNAVAFLVTEDKKMQNRARKAGLSDRVFDIVEAVRYLESLYLSSISTPVSLKEKYLYSLNAKDLFFDSLKKDYSAFESWWAKICKEHRKGYVHFLSDKSLGSLLVLKEENESLDDVTPVLTKKSRLKICTFKVADNGKKIGELFIKISIDFAIEKDIDEIYLTHYREKDDALENLIYAYGFKKYGLKKNGEVIYTKKLVPDKNATSKEDIFNYYYPSYYDGKDVDKFLVPIQPRYVDRLFRGQSVRQMLLDEFTGFIIEQNTITKAYVCNSSTHQLKRGDIVVFYASSPSKMIMSLGVIEGVTQGVRNTNELAALVGKRTVYSYDELRRLSAGGALVILFRHHFPLPKAIRLNEMRSSPLLLQAPQSIMKIDHEKYKLIKKLGDINERFTVH